MVITREIGLSTQGECDIVDITPQVTDAVTKSGIKDGTVTVFIAGSTAGVTTIEYEPGLISDLKAMWQRLVPPDIAYGHDQRWGDGNGYSHVRAALLGASLVVPVNHGRLSLGTWQQIVVIDFDNRPRSRKVILQMIGE